MPRFSGQFCKKWMREEGFFFFPQKFSSFFRKISSNLLLQLLWLIKDDLFYKSSNCLSHVAWHNHWIVLNLGSTNSSWNGAFVIFFREGSSIWSRLSILYGVIQFCERTWHWKVEDNAPWHQNFTRMSNLARNKCHAFADQC